MKIVMIHGQNHQGSTCHIGRLLAGKLGGEITEFFLPRDLSHFCLGCYQCLEDESRCPYYPEKRVILDSMEEADLLVFTTPTYCLHASAPMKSFLDLSFTYWMSHYPRQTMFEKKAVVISTAAGTGTRSAIKDITTALFYWGIPCIETYGISLQAAGWHQVSQKKKDKIERYTDALAKKLLMQTVRVGLKTKIIFHVMRLMHQSYDDGSPEKRYWAEQGWLGKKRPWKV